MNKQIFSESVISILKKHHRENRNRDRRPIFIFSCGGREDKHVARRMLKEFVERDREDLFRNVFFLKAENLANDPRMSSLDLLSQEAILADIADWLIIFAESVGTFCELGAFASLPHSVTITSVVVDKKHCKDDSFLMLGPVRVIEECQAPLSRLYCSDLKCPMANADFASTVNSIRKQVLDNEAYKLNQRRKNLNPIIVKNNDRGEAEGERKVISVGSLAHELLDLIRLFGPISESDIWNLYCEIKDIKLETPPIVSFILQQDMKSEITIKPAQLLAVLCSMDLVGEQKDPFSKKPMYYSKIQLEDYFMFKETDKSDFADMRAAVLLKRRKRGWEFEKNLYKRFDTD